MSSRRRKQRTLNSFRMLNSERSLPASTDRPFKGEEEEGKIRNQVMDILMKKNIFFQLFQKHRVLFVMLFPVFLYLVYMYPITITLLCMIPCIQQLKITPIVLVFYFTLFAYEFEALQLKWYHALPLLMTFTLIHSKLPEFHVWFGRSGDFLWIIVIIHVISFLSSLVIHVPFSFYIFGNIQNQNIDGYVQMIIIELCVHILNHTFWYSFWIFHIILWSQNTHIHRNVSQIFDQFSDLLQHLDISELNMIQNFTHGTEILVPIIIFYAYSGILPMILSMLIILIFSKDNCLAIPKVPYIQEFMITISKYIPDRFKHAGRPPHIIYKYTYLLDYQSLKEFSNLLVLSSSPVPSLCEMVRPQYDVKSRMLAVYHIVNYILNKRDEGKSIQEAQYILNKTNCFDYLLSLSIELLKEREYKENISVKNDCYLTIVVLVTLLSSSQVTPDKLSFDTEKSSLLIDLLSLLAFEEDDVEQKADGLQIESIRLLSFLVKNQQLGSHILGHQSQMMLCLEKRLSKLETLTVLYGDCMCRLLNGMMEFRLKGRGTTLTTDELSSLTIIYMSMLRFDFFKQKQLPLFQFCETIITGIYHLLCFPDLFANNQYACLRIMFNILSLQERCTTHLIESQTSTSDSLSTEPLPSSSTSSSSSSSSISSSSASSPSSIPPPPPPPPPPPSSLQNEMMKYCANILAHCWKSIRFLTEKNEMCRTQVPESVVLLLNDHVRNDEWNTRFPHMITQMKLTIPVLLNHTSRISNENSQTESSPSPIYDYITYMDHDDHDDNDDNDNNENNNSSNNDDDTCTICLEEYEISERLVQLRKCKHTFHPNCLDIWLMKHTTCPLCRSNLISQQ